MKIFSIHSRWTWVKGIAAAALGLAFGMGLMIGYRTVMADLMVSPSGAPSTSSSGVAPVSAHLAAADSVAKPAELIIPSIDVHAPVVGVGVAANGDLGVPSDAVHVAWYKDGPRPGQTGAAVIDGHLDTIHAPQAVFYNLAQLVPGDTIQVVSASGQIFTFKVTRTETLPYDAPTEAIFRATSTVPQLDLITCAGDWVRAIRLYNDRFVVFSELVSSSSSPAAAPGA